MAIVKGKPPGMKKIKKTEPSKVPKDIRKLEEHLKEYKRAAPEHVEVIGPQPGPQTMFLSSPADIVVYGGSAGGGKSFGLLLDPLRYANHSAFGAAILRRTNPEIKKEGGLWDEASGLYVRLKAKPNQNELFFRFPSGASIGFAHLQHEKNIYDWQGSQVPYLGFDELTHFTPRQFWYLQSRMRNVAGIPNLVRCTCNPDPDSFVRQLIDWWIDENGFAIPERSGKIRHFVRIEDSLKWDDNAENLLRRYPSLKPRSLTFIAAKLADNQILMQKDPNYLSTLLSLPSVERKRLLDGNWNVRPASGLYFKRNWFEIVHPDKVPPMIKVCRGWDLAGTADKNEKLSAGEMPAATAGVKLGRSADGIIYVLHMYYDRVSPKGVEKSIVNLASHDTVRCTIRLPQDPGQAGKFQVAHFAKLLMGYNFRSRVMSGDKVTRAGPFSAACENGRVRIVEGQWNETFLTQLEQFPPEVGYADVVDATVEAYHELTSAGLNVKNVTPVSILADI